MIKIKRQPTHPGKILREDFLLPLGLSQTELAEMLQITFRTVNEILNEKRGISPEMAVRLARFFGTSEELWLNLQDQYDLSGHRVQAHASGGLQRNFVRVLVGDRVLVQLSPHDLGRGRIVRRLEGEGRV